MVGPQVWITLRSAASSPAKKARRQEGGRTKKEDKTRTSRTVEKKNAKINEGREEKKEKEMRKLS